MKTAKLFLNTPVKRNIYIAGRRTSLQLEIYVWDCVDSILDHENLSLSMLCTELKIRSGSLRLGTGVTAVCADLFPHNVKSHEPV